LDEDQFNQLSSRRGKKEPFSEVNEHKFNLDELKEDKFRDYFKKAQKRVVNEEFQRVCMLRYKKQTPNNQIRIYKAKERHFEAL